MKVIYDGDCPVCQGLVAYARARDHEGALDFLPYQIDNLAAHAPGLDPQAASQALYAFPEGDLPVRGARGVLAVMGSLPGLWSWVARLLSLPPLVWLAEGCYRLFARSRYRIGAWLRYWV